MKGEFVLKANESVKNYPSERRMYANYAARSIKKVCKEIGPRFAGSEAEKKRYRLYGRRSQNLLRRSWQR